MKLSEYLQREREILNSGLKLNYTKTKKPFKEMINNLTLVTENIEKYFVLPPKLKDGKHPNKKPEIYCKKI
jgi:hypothetical protein